MTSLPPTSTTRKDWGCLWRLRCLWTTVFSQLYVPLEFVSSRRSRSRSRSKGGRQRRSSDRRRRSRSRDHRRKSSRSERRSGRRSRSRSRDRQSHRHARGHRRRESHHRRRSSSRDGHRHRRRSSPSRRHRRHSRSPDRKKGHRSEKKRRSNSPQPCCSTKTEDSAITENTTTLTNPGSNKPPVYKVAGVKFNRGRGTTISTFKDKMREEYRQQVQQAAASVMEGKSQPVTTGFSHLTSSVATVSAGTGVMGSGGLNQVLVNQMQLHLQQQQQYLPGQPGCLTPAQRELNQKFILQSTGRTREQVEMQYGVKLMTHYNEATNNMVEIAQREQKKGLLWKSQNSKKTEENSVFKAVPILPGQSRSENQKFARLMGCRKGEPKGEPKEEEIEEKSGEQINPEIEHAMAESQERNHRLEVEFENSRRFTHISRGVGLGYNTTMYQPH